MNKTGVYKWTNCFLHKKKLSQAQMWATIFILLQQLEITKFIRTENLRQNVFAWPTLCALSKVLIKKVLHDNTFPYFKINT